MINFVLIKKILETSEEDEKVIEMVLSNIIIVSEEIFRKKFATYVVSKMKDEKDMEGFIAIVEELDSKEVDQFNECLNWLNKHPDIDFAEFLQEFDEEMQKMQLDIIKGIRNSLDDRQKIEMVDFIEKQKEEMKSADDQYMSNLRLIYDELKAMASI